jgi:molybdopterin synthase sulfur carrier subunit
MPTIRIPNPLRSYVRGQAQVPVQGTTVGAAMEDLVTQFPDFRPHLYKQDGSLRAFVNLFLAAQNVRNLQGLETPLGPEDVLILIPSIAGG